MSLSAFWVFEEGETPLHVYARSPQEAVTGYIDYLNIYGAVAVEPIHVTKPDSVYRPNGDACSP